MDAKRKRKRKKSELQKARKYAKKEWFGRGTHVDEETYRYFLNVYEENIDKMEVEEEKLLTANTALKQTEGKEVHLSSNQFISRVTEKLLPYANDDVLLRYIKAFDDLRILCTDNFASYVVQTLVKVCANRYRKDGTKSLRDFVVKTSMFIFNNIDEFIYNPYANQIGRCCLKECAGSENEDSISIEAVEGIGNRVLQWPELKEMAINELTSGFLQCLLHCLSRTKTKLAQKIIKRILEECFIPDSYTEGEKNKLAEGEIDSFFLDMPSTRLLEAAIEVASRKRYTKIYLKIYANRLKILSCHKSSCISVQKLISRCPGADEFKLILEELLPSLSEIIATGLLGVILELAKSCSRLNTSEGEFLKALKVALKVEHSVCGELVTKLVYNSGTTGVDKNGSLILQTILQFKKPISVVESLLSVDPKVLKDIFLDLKGSYIAEAFVASKTIGDKSRERLIQKMKGNYKDLVVDKYGSRVVEAFWSRANLKEKHIIMGELDRSILKTQHGSIIASKFRLNLYLSKKHKWASVGDTTSPAEMFSTILK